MATARYVTNPFSKPIKVGSLTFQPGETHRLHRNWVYRNYPEGSGLEIHLTPPDNWKTPQVVTPPARPAKEEVAELVVVPDPIPESASVVEDEAPSPPEEEAATENIPDEDSEEEAGAEEVEAEEVEAEEEDGVWTLEELSSLRKADLKEILTEEDVEFDSKASKKQLISLILGG